MRANIIINLPPIIKDRLAFLQVTDRMLLDDFLQERAIETFLLALGLRMKGTTMGDRNPQSNQPSSQGGMPCRQIEAPRRSIIHQHSFWQAKTLKDGDELLLNRDGFFIGTGLQPNEKA